MKWSVPAGRVFGGAIRLHVTFLLVLLWIAWVGWEVDGPACSLWALALILGLFACIVLHELGHSLVAIHFGGEVRSITLLPIGGVASMRALPDQPRQEFLVAVAGPLVNLVIALLLAALRGRWPTFALAAAFPRSGAELLAQLTPANFLLVAFNLIPAFPMDGGRILRSFLATFLPYPRATAWAAAVGQFLAVAFIIFGFMHNLFLMFIGFFVFLGAGTEEHAVRVRHLLHAVLVRDVMLTDFVCLHPDDRLERCLEYVYHRKQEDFPVTVDGYPVGILPRADWLAALHRLGGAARVGDIMQTRFISLSPATELEKAYPSLGTLEQAVFPVLESGRVVGLLTMADIGRYLVVQEARDARRKPPPLPRRPAGFTVDLG